MKETTFTFPLYLWSSSTLKITMILPPPKCAVRLVPRKRLLKAQTASIIALKETWVELERIVQITGTSRATVFRVLRLMKQAASPIPHTVKKIY